MSRAKLKQHLNVLGRTDPIAQAGAVRLEDVALNEVDDVLVEVLTAYSDTVKNLQYRLQRYMELNVTPVFTVPGDVQKYVECVKEIERALEKVKAPT